MLVFLLVIFPVCFADTDIANWDAFLPDLHKHQSSAVDGGLSEYNADYLDGDSSKGYLEDALARFKQYPLHNILFSSKAYSSQPLWTIHHASNIYSEYVGRDLTVFTANGWSKLFGYSCPAGHHKHVIKHHIFSDLFVCILVPEKLVVKYRVYSIVQNVRTIKLICPKSFPAGGGMANTYSHVTFAMHSDHIRLLKDTDNNEYLISTYCLSHYYQLDTSGKEIFEIPYNVTDTTVTFHLPQESCAPVKLPGSFSQKHNMLPITLTFKSDGNPSMFNMRKCILDDLAKRQKSCPKTPLLETGGFPMSATEAAVFTINGPCSSWSQVGTVVPELTVHISAASSASPLHMLTTAFIALLKPILDFILDRILYVFEEVLTIFESDAFQEVVSRMLNVMMTIFTKTMAFLLQTVWPKLIEFYFSLSLRMKFIIISLCVLYARTTKFWLSCGIAVAAGMFVSS